MLKIFLGRLEFVPHELTKKNKYIDYVFLGTIEWKSNGRHKKFPPDLIN
jgi:hypothetical protein